MISVSYSFEISVNIICNVTSLEGQHNYRPLTKLRKGNVFTPVCQSFCSQGVSASVHAGIHNPPGQTHPLCPVHAGIDSATAADGTHPTGMHSCLVEISKYRYQWKYVGFFLVFFYVFRFECCKTFVCVGRMKHWRKRLTI